VLSFVRTASATLTNVATAVPALAENQARPQAAVTIPASQWHFMQDAVVFGMYNHQGDRRGGFQVFFRLRPPAGPMGRMWNTRMSQPMKMVPADPHAGHQLQ
jgi:hypothetical protein